jgi:Ca2+-binding RTX toxin-like protein
MRSGFLAALLVVACGGLIASPAIAGTALNTSSRDLSYTAWAGEANLASISWDARGVLIADHGAILVLGCLPLDLKQVRCLAPGFFPLLGCDAACHLTVTLGDNVDRGSIFNAPVGTGLTVLLDGGSGRDTLMANQGTIVGGEGDDSLFAFTDPGAHSHLVCGPGEDWALARPGDAVDADCEHVERQSASRSAAAPGVKTAAAAAIRNVGGARR